MISFFNTVGDVKKFLDGFPDTMLVGSLQRDECQWLDQLQAEWVVVEVNDLTVVGSEAEDDEMNLRPGQANALAFS